MQDKHSSLDVLCLKCGTARWRCPLRCGPMGLLLRDEVKAENGVITEVAAAGRGVAEISQGWGTCKEIERG